jgi:hypothetical protein
MSSNGRPPLASPSSILKELKQLDDKERLYQAKILEIGAQRAQLIRLLENSMGSLLTRSVHLDSEAAIPVALSTQQHGISAANGDVRVSWPRHFESLPMDDIRRLVRSTRSIYRHHNALGPRHDGILH